MHRRQPDFSFNEQIQAFSQPDRCAHGLKGYLTLPLRMFGYSYKRWIAKLLTVAVILYFH